MNQFTRRSLLRKSASASAVLTFGGLAPSVLEAAAQSSQTERILVVVELAGGNDGLNTVIPFDDATYRKLRPKLAVSEV